jgi:hypothetical protein
MNDFHKKFPEMIQWDELDAWENDDEWDEIIRDVFKLNDKLNVSDDRLNVSDDKFD